MRSKKCPHCGLVNFADAETCKRCNAEIADVVAAETSAPRPSAGWPLKILVAVLAIALLGLIFFAARNRTRDLSDISSTPTVTGSPTPEPLSPANVESAKKALDAVYKLQSAVDAGLTLNQYSDRVLDTKAEVDSALRSMSSETNSDKFFKENLEKAMFFFVEARNFWSDSIQHDYPKEARSEALNAAWQGAQNQITHAESLLPKK